MFSLFKKKSQGDNKRKPRLPELPSLDNAFYPLLWQEQYFDSALMFLRHLLQSEAFKGLEHQITKNPYKSSSSRLAADQKIFSQRLQDNDTYHDWINFTVFGRYVQRSFSVFYQQSEDVFNADMPELLRYELMRYTQCLPVGQVLLSGGKMPASVRREKLLVATLNPFQAIAESITSRQAYSKQTLPNIINVITIKSQQVKAFAIKHNKHTSASMRNEVMILDFNHLILLQEERLEQIVGIEQIEVDTSDLVVLQKNVAQSGSLSDIQLDTGYLIRHYQIG